MLPEVPAIGAQQTDVAMQDEAGCTALYYAAQGGHEEVLEILLQAGAAVTVASDVGRTALTESAWQGFDKVVEILLAAGADVAYRSEGRYSKTALYWAARKGKDDIVKRLLNAGAGEKSYDMQEALHIAASEGHDQVIESLLNAGADPLLQDEGGQTALHDAAREGHGKVVQILLSAGADPLIRDVFRWTALQRAAWSGHSQAMALVSKALSDLPNKRSPRRPLSFPSDGCVTDSVILLDSLVLTYPEDTVLRRALGNEFWRRKMYSEAQMSFDMAVGISMQNAGLKEVMRATLSLCCDGCQTTIRGYQYKCKQCIWDYDVCQKCIETSGHPHPQDLVKLPSDQFSVDGLQSKR
jgi:uncharacterized protein